MSQAKINLEFRGRLKQLEDQVAELLASKKKTKLKASGAPKGALHELDHHLLNPYLKDVTHDLQKTFMEVYGNGDAGWTKEALLQAVTWIKANPEKQPKSNFGRFFSNWLKRAYEDERKRRPSVRPSNVVPLPKPKDTPTSLPMPYEVDDES